jgi:hypothetical protein
MAGRDNTVGLENKPSRRTRGCLIENERGPICHTRAAQRYPAPTHPDAHAYACSTDPHTLGDADAR